MSWRLAEALKTLRSQLNNLFPNRDKTSDGGIGDAAHASRKSDHNPWVKDKNGVGVVTAFDFDHDPDENGIDARKLAEILFKNKDPRIKYLIFDRRITTQDKSGWKPYTGSNAHKQHIHVSVSSDPKLYDSSAPWKLDFADELTSSEVPSSAQILKKGDKGAEVREIQVRLAKLRMIAPVDVDGNFGSITENAVKTLQRQNGLAADGIVGEKTRRII